MHNTSALLALLHAQSKSDLCLFEEGNKEWPVQWLCAIHACVGSCRIEVRVPRQLQCCRTQARLTDKELRHEPQDWYVHWPAHSPCMCWQLQGWIMVTMADPVLPHTASRLE